MNCSKCKKEIVKPDRGGTGYGTTKFGRKICYDCCAESDKRQMRKHGKIILYLVTNKETGCYNVTNWPGTLSFIVIHITFGRHNIAGKRYDVWFNFENQQWHGVLYGDNTEICYCKRNIINRR